MTYHQCFPQPLLSTLLTLISEPIDSILLLLFLYAFVLICVFDYLSSCSAVFGFLCITVVLVHKPTLYYYQWNPIRNSEIYIMDKLNVNWSQTAQSAESMVIVYTGY